MKRLLLIGGAGFFGKSFLDCFQRGQLEQWRIGELVIMSRNPTRLLYEAPKLVDARVRLLPADITTAVSLPEADYVIHAAASTDARSYVNQADTEALNIKLGTYNYCSLAPSVHVQSKILFVSSGAVYGHQPASVEYLHERQALYGVGLVPEGKRDYASAKRLAERAFQDLALQDMKVAIARCFAFVGPWLPRDQHFAIGNFISDGLAGRDINIKAKHIVYRSYMHSDDLVKWLMSICENANSTCPVYNVGSDRAVTIEQLAHMVARQLGIAVMSPELRTNEVERYIPSITKAKTELGLELSIDLERAILQTIEAIKRHKYYAQ